MQAAPWEQREKESKSRIGAGAGELQGLEVELAAHKDV